jgi:hypothetical protein
MIITKDDLRKILKLLKESKSSMPIAEYFPVQGPYNVGYDSQGLGRGVRPKVFGKNARHSSDYRPYKKWSKSRQKMKGPHFGIDIFAPLGTLVVSPIDGYVTSYRAEEKGKGGKIINISTTPKKRDGWTYYHAHLDSVSADISKGDYIKAGTIIGKVGDTGNARGKHPHLHFSLYYGGQYGGGAVDPFESIKHLVDSGQVIDSTNLEYKAALSDPKWERSNVLALEKILDQYKDLGTPDHSWTGGIDAGSTDESWREIINQGVRLLIPDITEEQIKLIGTDWYSGAAGIGYEGNPAGALKFAQDLHNAIKNKSDNVEVVSEGKRKFLSRKLINKLIKETIRYDQTVEGQQRARYDSLHRFYQLSDRLRGIYNSPRSWDQEPLERKLHDLIDTERRKLMSMVNPETNREFLETELDSIKNMDYDEFDLLMTYIDKD